MGSFNTTCFASNQTIAPNELCRVMVISQNATYSPVALTQDDKDFELYGVSSSTCYANAFWEPVTSFLPAKYDDYGRVELLLGEHAMANRTRAQMLHLFHALLSSCPKTKKGENSCHDLDFNFGEFLEGQAPTVRQLLAENQLAKVLKDVPEGLDGELLACWEYMADRMHEHRLFFRKAGRVVRPMQLAILHEHAYQSLVAEAATYKTWDGQSKEQTAVLARMLASARKRSEGSLDLDIAPDRVPIYKAFRMAEVLREALSDAGGDVRYYSSHENSILNSLGAGLVLGRHTDEEAMGILRPLLDDRYALAALSGLNLHLAPMSYAGQDYSNEEGQRYARFVADVSHKVTRSSMEQTFGPFQTYTLKVTDPKVMDELSALAKESWDARLGVQSVTLDLYGSNAQYLALFECTLDLDDLLETLSERVPKEMASRVLVDTLLLWAAAPKNC
jgi:hypothetical protein